MNRTIPLGKRGRVSVVWCEWDSSPSLLRNQPPRTPCSLTPRSVSLHLSLFLSFRPRNHYDDLMGFGLDNVESVIENGVSLAGEDQDPMVLGRYLIYCRGRRTRRDETRLQTLYRTPEVVERPAVGHAHINGGGYLVALVSHTQYMPTTTSWGKRVCSLPQRSMQEINARSLMRTSHRFFAYGTPCREQPFLYRRFDPRRKIPHPL